MRVFSLFLISLFSFVVNKPMLAIELNPLKEKDIGFVTGIAAGVINDPSREDPVILGGIPFALRLTDDLIGEYSLIYQGGILLDLVSSQIVQQSVEGGIAWHFFGGARKTRRVTSLGTLEGESSSNLSLAARGAYSKFSASSKEDPNDTVTGSLIELKTGLEYRMELFYNAGIGIEIMFSLLGFPASTERLSHTGMNLNIMYRTTF